MKKIDVSKLKSVGVVRAVDKLGRLVISSETREVMGIGRGDLVEQKLCQNENGEYIIIVRKWEE